MSDSFGDISRQTFYDVAKKDELDVDFILTNKKDFPYFLTKPRLAVVIPIPRLVEEKIYLQSFVFDDLQKQSLALWSLYLASIYHVGAHVAISNFEIYKNWSQNKTQELAQRAIDFVEDLRIENYLKQYFPQSAQNIIELDSKYNAYFQKIFSSDNVSKKKFLDFYLPNGNKKLTEIKEKIIENNNDSSNLIECADIIYKNRYLLNPFILPYHDQLNKAVSLQIFKPIKFNPVNSFQKTCSILNDTWVKEISKQRKILQKYKQLSRDLRFDEIEISPENFSEYLRLNTEASQFVKKIKNKLRMISNIIDRPKDDQVGILEMQKAIQAVSSETDEIEVFERDEDRRIAESWAIILDSSASMKGKFHDLKKFTMCLSDAADEITSINGKWSLSVFNNNFYVVKDFAERYNQQIKSRLGGINAHGLSFIPDAIILSTRTLELDRNERKYIFLVSDGKTLGYNDADKYFSEAISSAQSAGVNVIGIGIPAGTSKLYSACVGYEQIANTISQFIRAYVSVAQNDL